MPLDIHDTHYMLAAVEELPLEHTFFKDRYFPTDDEMDVFGTAKVLGDYREGTQKIAPFVVPRIGSIPVGRDGFSTYELEPGNISISLPLHLDQLQNRGFGESLLSRRTPAERARHFLIDDLNTLSKMITRREEWLAVNTMLNNGCTMRHETDQQGVYEDVEVKFYDGDSNTALFTPANTWAHSTKSGETWTPGNWYDDMYAMIKMLSGKGRPVREFVVSQDVAAFLMTDGWFCAMLDNRNVNLGVIDPESLTEDVYSIGSFNFYGRKLPILVNTATYEEGGDQPYMPNGTVMATAPKCGRGLYGGVTQLEKDGEYHTYAGKRVPLHLFTIVPPMKATQLSARPLFAPKRKDPWVVAKNVLPTN